eukprot:925776-Pleurochrysis_carterae.AAC.1
MARVFVAASAKLSFVVFRQDSRYSNYVSVQIKATLVSEWETVVDRTTLGGCEVKDSASCCDIGGWQRRHRPFCACVCRAVRSGQLFHVRTATALIAASSAATTIASAAASIVAASSESTPVAAIIAASAACAKDTSACFAATVAAAASCASATSCAPTELSAAS